METDSFLDLLNFESKEMNWGTLSRDDPTQDASVKPFELVFEIRAGGIQTTPLKDIIIRGNMKEEIISIV
jgi:hypothetical protein